MNFLIVSGNPKDEGLCAGLISEISRGARDGGADVRVVVPSGLDNCHVCGSGWGNCRTSRRCVFGGDGFDELFEAAKNADALCFASPVYWGETSEILKSFLDRLRRCAAPLGGNGSGLSGKQTILAVSAGGTGNGVMTAMEQLDRFCQHTAAPVFDRFMQNRWNADHVKQAAYCAAKAVAEGRKNGDTV